MDIKSIAALCAAASMILCSSLALGAEPQVVRPVPPDQRRQAPEPYTRNTLIISLEPDMTSWKKRRIAKRHDLEIIYEYKNFSMMAVKTKKDLEPKEMERLIKELEKEKGVLQVSRDRILQLQDAKKAGDRD